MKALKNDKKEQLILDLIFLTVLILYPLRHISWGLDMWDTGYSYANYVYMEAEHMSSMWLFSTYLATVVGNLITLLPGAGGMLGMNFYTSLFLSGLAAGGYLFCSRAAGIPRGIAFVGEMAALSLCWCPSAILYNYLRYVLLLGCVILLYKGLTGEKRWHLFGAGLCLGSNVLVRFSNLPEMGLIAAVWAWDLILWLESRRAGGSRAVKEGQNAGKGGGYWRLLVRHTSWCLGGYLAALFALLGYIHARYGISSYIEGISRLFGMTEKAPDYKAAAMVGKLFDYYRVNWYWAARIGAIILVGVAGFTLLGYFNCRATRPEEGGESAGGGGLTSGIWKVLWRLARIGWLCVAALMVAWLYKRGFCSLYFYNYGPIERPAILFMMLTMLIGAIRIFCPGSPREEKLLSGLVILVILLTSIGSNNGVYPSINNLFVAAPYTLWECWKFARYGKDWRIGRIRGLVVRLFPVKAVMTAFLALFLFQSAVFGAKFFFQETLGAQNITDVIDNNEVLKGIRMDSERAEWMSGISGYVNDHGLRGREVILYGNIPALSYYLQMPAAFHPWCDLDSYSSKIMGDALQDVAAGIEDGTGESPVIIMERESMLYLEGGETALREAGVAESRIDRLKAREDKNQLLKDFMERFHYDLTYENGKFWVFEAGKPQDGTIVRK